MATRGSNLEKNPFKRAMVSSYSVAGQISQFLDDTLNANQASDSRIADLYTIYKPINIGLNKAIIGHEASFNPTTGSGVVFTQFAGMYNLNLAAGTLTYSAVPLPAAVWMFGAGLMGVLRFTRRKSMAV